MSEQLSALQDTEYDVLIAGGGINGAAVARDAALRGFRVVLVEKHDFGFGASSRTSKLVHGGLRYLEQRAFRLVWEACHERRILLATAPHLVRPLPLVFPVYKGSRIGAARLRAGMWLYDLMAAFRNVRRHRMLPVRGAGTWLAELEHRDLQAAALYYDAQMDDARLALENVIAAGEAGATLLNHVAVDDWRLESGRVRGATLVDTTGRRIEARARCIVTCTGAWTNHVVQQLGGGTKPVAPTRGSHLVVRRFTDQAFTLAARADGRVFFVLPYLGLNLIGTTDVPCEDPDDLAPTAAEVEYLLGEANHYFPAARLEPGDVVAAFAGLRPLLRASGEASARPREHALLEPAPYFLCVVGGKYTTYRAVAEQVVDRLESWLGKRRPCRTGHEPLPGAQFTWSAADHWQERGGFLAALQEGVHRTRLPEAAVRRQLGVYGARAAHIWQLIAAAPQLRRALCPHTTQCQAEVVHAVRAEFARHLDDWLLRRSRMAFLPCHGRDALEDIANLFASELAWTPEERQREIERGGACLDGLAISAVPASSRSA